jgi:hypothetical protein
MTVLVAKNTIITSYGKGIILRIRLDRILVVQLNWAIVYIPAPSASSSYTITPSVTALATELDKRRPIVSRIRHHINALGYIPSVYREAIYRVLLKVPHTLGNNTTLEEMTDVSKDETNQRVIRADVLRTRGADLLFQQETTRNNLESLLTYFCKRKGTKYCQGLNEIVAPFFWISPTNNSLRFELFYAFIDKFVPNMFLEETFQALQCAHVLFGTLLQHFDVRLYEHLTDSDLTPELYTTPWFLTLCAAKLQQDDILCVWDQLLSMQPDEHAESLVHFIILALLMKHRDMLLKTPSFDLPHVIVHLGIEKDIQHVLSTAMLLLENTPNFFHKLVSITTRTPEKELKNVLQDVLNLTATAATTAMETKGYDHDLDHDHNHYDSNDDNNTKEGFVVDLLSSSLKTVVLPVMMEDIKTFFVSPASSSTKYYFLDCRTFHSFHRIGHFPMSFHIDPTVVNESEVTLEWIRRELDIFKSMSNQKIGSQNLSSCLVVIGSQTDGTIRDAQNLIKLLLLWRFNRLSTFINFDVMFTDEKYQRFLREHVIISSREEQQFALESMQASVNQWKSAMEPVEPVNVRPLTHSMSVIKEEKKEKEKEKEKAEEIDQDLEKPEAEQKEEQVLIKAAPISDSLRTSTALLAKGATALSNWWNSTAATTDTAASSIDFTNLHRGDSVKKDIILSNGGLHIRRVHTKSSLVGQYIFVTSTHVIFLQEHEKEDEMQMHVLSKYPISCLLKVASRQKDTLLLLILTFAHTPTISIATTTTKVPVVVVAAANEEKPKKIGLVTATEDERNHLVETIKGHYKLLKSRS